MLVQCCNIPLSIALTSDEEHVFNKTGRTINPDYLWEIFYGIQGNWLNYNIERSLNNTSIEEKHLGAEQVTQTLKTIIYFNFKIDDLIDMAKKHGC